MKASDFNFPKTTIISDIDGVLFDFLSAFCRRLISRFGFGPRPDDFTTYDLTKTVADCYGSTRMPRPDLVTEFTIKSVILEDSGDWYEGTIEAFNAFLWGQADSKLSNSLRFVTSRSAEGILPDALKTMIIRLLGAKFPILHRYDRVLLDLAASTVDKLELVKCAATNCNHLVLYFEDAAHIIEAFEKASMPRNLVICKPRHPYNGTNPDHSTTYRYLWGTENAIEDWRSPIDRAQYRKDLVQGDAVVVLPYDHGNVTALLPAAIKLGNERIAYSQPDQPLQFSTDSNSTEIV